MEPITDREIMIKLDGNVTHLTNTIERFAKTLENLETVKIKDHENRISKMERNWSEFGGVYKLISILGLIGGIVGFLMGVFRLK